MNKGALILLMVLPLSWGFSAYSAKSNVEEILKSVEKKASPPNERVTIKMVIQEPDGSKRERVLNILRKNSKEARALIRLLKPADLKGLSLLTIAPPGGQEEQWLYLPSDKKSRRILGSSKKGKFLDSEIAYEDLSLSTYKDFENKITKEDAKTVEIESVAKPDSPSSYGKIVTWVNVPANTLERVEYYDKDLKLLKRAQFTDYKKVGGDYWRAQNVSVQNVQTERKTILLLQKLSLDKIRDDEVSRSALEE